MLITKVKLCIMFCLGILASIFAAVMVDAAELRAGNPGNLSEFHYDFSKLGEYGIELNGGAKISDGMLRLDGIQAYARIADSSNINFSKKGTTLTSVVRFKGNVSGDVKMNHNMLIFYKEKAFFFGRTGDKYNFSLCCDGKNWSEALVGGETPPFDEWVHLAAVAEYVNDSAQGNVGYKLSIYVNGELQQHHMFSYIDPDKSDALIEIGRGLKGYEFKGDIAEITFYNRVMTDNEIATSAMKSKLVKFKRSDAVPIPKAIEQKITKLNNEAHTPHAAWAVKMLERAGKTGFAQQELLKVIDAVSVILTSADPLEKFVADWNQAQKTFLICTTPQLVLMTVSGKGKCSFPIIGLLNRMNNSPVFSGNVMEWDIAFREPNGKERMLKSFSDGVEYTVSDFKTTKESIEFRIDWTSPLFDLHSNVKLAGPRLEINLDVDNKAKDCIIDNVTFPAFRIAHLPGKEDVLVYPHMSGILGKNPTAGFSKGSSYPTSRVNMQFSAYYDENGNGIYFAFEDPLARVKEYSVTGKLNRLHADWKSPVPKSCDFSGGNSYKMSGNAVVEVYKGDWFEAGQIYKRFLAEKSKWWIKDLPRKSTPEWYRNNPLWMLTGAGTRTMHEQLYFREYFEVPYAVVWSHWYNDLGKEEWPHLYSSKQNLQAMKELQKAGVRVKAYINGRLWAYIPSPLAGKSEWLKSSHCKELSCKNGNGEIIYEEYKECEVPYKYAIMCPAAKGWQDWMSQECLRIAEYGHDAVYHDQVPCAPPRICFDPGHGHMLNDPSQWIENGYWAMYEKIRKTVSEKYPDVAHDGEEASDPYLRALDGYMVWRWVDLDHVPLFQSIYVGRIQFTGRLYDFYNPGSYESFFAKIGEQLVFGEQLGWFHINNMRYASPRRLYAKKLAHLRIALLHYFNEADMLRPLDFKTPVPLLKTLWGSDKPRQIIETPKILNSAWKRADGRIMIVFLNTVNETMKCKPVLNFGNNLFLTICRGDKKEAETIRLDGKNTPAVTLVPYEAEVWLLNAAPAQEEAAKITATLNKITEFNDNGLILNHKQDFSQRKRVNVELGKWITPVDSSWMVRCFMPKWTCLGFDKGRWIQAQDGGIVYFGEVDFGNGGGKFIEVDIAVNKESAGGKIAFYDISGDGDPEKCLAEMTTDSTGDWFDYKVVKIPLKQELKGKRDVIVGFGGKGCNFKGWRIVGNN